VNHNVYDLFREAKI